MQLMLGLVPQEYADSRLYKDLVPNKGSFWIDTGIRELCFYDSNAREEHYKKHEILKIKFPNFNMAYEFILKNNIKNFNIRSGCYDEEIKQYKEQKWKN